MRSVKMMMAAGAASLIASTAMAADMPIAPPPAYAPPPAEDFGGWYLRGDIGFSNQKVKDLRYGRDSAYSQLTSFDQQTSFDAAGIYGLGVGYQFNSWFRADLVGQYRGNSNFKGTDRFTGTSFGTPYNGIDNYGASKSEWLVMANGYVDLGTWWCVTPFIGAGVGAARVTMANFTDTGINNLPFSTTSFASAPTASKWNLAWALHTGLAYKVNPNLTLELAYSYLNLGDGYTGALSDYVGNTTNNTFKFKDITSHDVKLGVRWNIDSGPVYAAPPPLMRKG
ncbi:outer membrane beta-barrel protein [Rhodopseudomonas palustris]|uniref:outer membrane protein n=1 Tax=Rhodopseudomonas palustris TaxID=1076 RepID=UPI0020CC03AD|nr:outer membrane beta-barrel protein [Rhodopseudomonas palustris]MCP9629646.1 outer membrane beta-barrel protein [Rhodopseudomonas palustris]